MIEILYDEDDDLIAINKPARIAPIPGRGEVDSALARLSRQIKLPHSGTSDPRLRVVHRLDKDTSGVLLFARNLAAQRHLSHQFQNNTVEKEYLAIIVGRPSHDEGEVDAPIGRHPTKRDRMAVLTRGGRAARTIWKLERAFRHYSLLRVYPKTGKTHQVRVHLAHVGMPLAVDPLYNRPAEAGKPVGIFLSSFKRDYRPKPHQPERPLIDRLTLHAHRLTFKGMDDRPVTVEADLPKDWRATINMLNKHG